MTELVIVRSDGTVWKADSSEPSRSLPMLGAAATGTFLYKFAGSPVKIIESSGATVVDEI